MMQINPRAIRPEYPPPRRSMELISTIARICRHNNADLLAMFSAAKS
ncbi:MAG: hypothetical protein Q8M11_18210 [Sulfuritalea sp.]|nr:hypothetical protein [Sulfuritalea sp.]